MLPGKVVDADGHILEPPQLWQEYLERVAEFPGRSPLLELTSGDAVCLCGSAALFPSRAPWGERV